MAQRKLSFRAAHSYLEMSRSGDSLYLGASPLPVFALVRVPIEQARAMRDMLDQYIRDTLNDPKEN